MGEENPRKKRWWKKRRHPNPNSLQQPDGAMRAASTSEPEPSLHPLRAGTPRRHGLVRKLWDNVFKSHSSGAVQRSPNPTSSVTSSSGQDHPLAQAPSPLYTALAPEGNPDQASGAVEGRIANAYEATAGMNSFTGIVQNTASATDGIQSGLDTIGNFSSIIEPLKVFNSIVNGIANIHPYAQVVMSIFTCASKMILNQATLDNAILGLLETVSEVYTFMNEDGRLVEVPSMQTLYGKVARQTLECADFIVHYSETKSVWTRLGKHIFDETGAVVQSYSNILNSLMQQFRDRAARDTVVDVHCMVENMDFRDMVYADGAGRDTSKHCLPGTREDILSNIKNWIDNTEEDVQRILWLSGTAGKGKSAIAHTIASWFHERGGLGAFFCFDRTREADRRHEKIFTTVARDLADRDPIMRRALARAVRDNEIRHTKDITRQWQELILGPVDIVSKAIPAPVLIIIDALDESGDTNSRQQILRLLASQPTKLPANFRIVVTSRPLEDIQKSLHAASHILHCSMDDIRPESAERDIQRYVTTRLADLHDALNDADFQRLAQKSDGLFEWARLACEYIKGTNRVRVDPISRFEAVVAKAVVGASGIPVKGTRLLDDMYRRILAEIIPEDEHEEVIHVFRSVMGQILASLEPLPKNSLTAMRLHFSPMNCLYKIDNVIGSMGSLFAGTADPETPIRPLHASFYDFLGDPSRSHRFFVDISSVQSDLAFASLRVMKHGLRFNICSLESSYLPNCDIANLEERVKQSIPVELSYSCRFWGTHVGATPIGALLAQEVKAFFDGERLLFWMEALSLIKKGFGSAVQTLLSIAGWCKGHIEYMHISDVTHDTMRFIGIFGVTILHSTPHLYLSALPFAPSQSNIFRKFAGKFPCTPRFVAGHVARWPVIEKTFHPHAIICSVTFSLNGKHIVCGSRDGTIRMWDADTGEALNAPFRGHTDWVSSVAVSPHGKHIVSGSFDKTIRVWDAETGEALGAPLEGHTDEVSSVAISPDGKHIVSGSRDRTIRVWDAETRNTLGAPLEGHTDSVHCVAISPNGKYIVSGSRDRTIRVWDTETRSTLGAPLKGHTGSVYCVAISPNGKYIVSGSRDRTIRVWDVETGNTLGAPLKGHTDNVYSIAISPDEKCIVSASADETIRVWDVETGDVLGSPLHGHTNSVISIAISPDGNRIVSGSADRIIQVWNIEAPALYAPLQSHTSSVTSVTISQEGYRAIQGTADNTIGERRDTGTDSVFSVATSPDGQHIVSGLRDRMIQVWDAVTEPLALGASPEGHAEAVSSVAISPDGKYIVSGSYDMTIQVWDAETRNTMGALLEGHTDTISSVAISSDGKHIVSGSRDRTIRVWDAETRNTLGAPLKGHTDTVTSVAISPDGKYIVSGSHDRKIRVWDAETRNPLGAPLEGHTDSVYCVAISPNGKYIVSGSYDKTIWVWDAETGKTFGAPLKGHTDKVFSVTISPDGRHIVSGSHDRTIRVWDAETCEASGTPLLHSDSVISVAISPDGKRIVSGLRDNTIWVWDIETREPLGPALRGHTNGLASVTISPDGNYIVSGSWDCTVRVWDVGHLNTHRRPKARPICFSPNPTHALRSAASFLQDSPHAVSLVMTEEGWVVGPEERLLIRMPLSLHPVMYAPHNTLVISKDVSPLDLSHFAHGTSWDKCREEFGASSQ